MDHDCIRHLRKLWSHTQEVIQGVLKGVFKGLAGSLPEAFTPGAELRPRHPVLRFRFWILVWIG